jgi:phage gp29-like protein
MPRRTKSLVKARVQPAPAPTNGHAPNGKLVASTAMINVTNRDRMLFELSGELRPDQLAGILRQALLGSLIWQERLFEKMVDSWPRLEKNLLSLKNDVADLDWTVKPYAEKDAEPTDSAIEKAALVERALLGMEGDPTLDTSDFSGMVKDVVDAVPCGFSISEIYWTTVEGEIVPQYTKKLPARFFGYSLSPEQPDQLMLNPKGNLAFTWEALEPFPANKFLVGVYKGNLSHPTIGAKLRCLTPYWLGHKYGWKWLMVFAQVFGSPTRIAHYTPGDDDTFNKLCSMLEQMGNAGWGAFPAGAEVELMEPKSTAGTLLPQRVLTQDANEECDLTILGQVLTSTAGRAGGNRALGEVHADTERKVLNGTAKFVKTVVKQLIKAILFLNYGEVSELPTLEGATEEPQDELALAQRDAILFGSSVGQLQLPVAKDFLYSRHSVPEPADDADLYIPTGVGKDEAFDDVEPELPPVLPFGAVPPPGGIAQPPASKDAPGGEPGAPAKATASDAGMFVPSMQMAAAVKRGLDLRKKMGSGGSLSVITRARDIGQRKALSVSTVRRMQIYFDSHLEDGKAAPESAPGIAWALHGGNAGRAWVEQVCKASQVEAFNKNHVPGGEKGGQFTSGGGSGSKDSQPSKPANEYDSKYPVAGEKVDGRTVGDKIPNEGSISSSLDDYEVLKGVREVNFSSFDQMGKLEFYSSSEKERTSDLADRIKASGHIDPLIVVHDKEGPYVLEGAHRFDALRMLGAKSFPALVVLDTRSIAKGSA